MKPEYCWYEKLQYRMDNMISKGPWVMVFWLGLLSITIVILASVLIVALNITQPGNGSISFIEAFWQSLLRTLDPGTMADDSGWGYRLIMLGVTMGGIFVISTFIGVLTTNIEERLENLRRGRSKVIESGHTVILGWNEQVYTIIEELILANANQPEGCVAIMGEGDKLEMETLIREKVEDTRNTKIVVRSGNPIEMSDLGIVSVNTAKAIIVLSPEGDDPDSQVIKTCLAITRNPRRKPENYHIVAELRNPRNKDIARVVGGDEIEWLLSGEIIAKVIAQTCRQSGLSVVYTDLFDFEGNEIYFFEAKDFVGWQFGDILNCFDNNAVMGLFVKGGKQVLNPPMDSVIAEGDQVFLLAEDDDRIFVTESQEDIVQCDLIVERHHQPQNPESFVLLGWNWRAPQILVEVDHYVAPGSKFTIVCDPNIAEDAREHLPQDLVNLGITFIEGEITERSLLESLVLRNFDYVILLCYSDQYPVQVADAHTLITLLHLRDISSKMPDCHYSITSEMMDIRNRNLAEVAHADDFIVSDKLISLLFSQISEEKNLHAVFSDIFDPEGSELYLKSAEDYIVLEQPVNFHTVVESARRKSETALGYRIFDDRHDASKNYGIVLNPQKSAEIIYQAQDKIIVLAEE